MQNIIYIVAILLIIGWTIGFIGYGTGGIIHVLLIIAAIAVIIQLIRGKKFN